MRTVHSREAFESLREHFGDKLVRHDDPPVDRLRGVGRARDLDPRLPPGPRRRLPGLADEVLGRLGSRRPAAARAACGARRSRSGAWSSAAELARTPAPWLERRAHDVGPAVGLAPQRPTTAPVCSRWHHTSTVGPAPEIVAPSAPSVAARCARARTSAGTGARGRAGAAGRAGRARRGPSRHAPGRAPAARRGATLKTASAIGTASGSAARASSVRTGSCGHDEHAPPAPPADVEPRRARRRRRSRTRPAARRRRCRDGPRARVASASTSASSSKRWSAATSPATIRGGARPQPAAERDLRPDPEREPVGRVQPLERRARARLRRSRGDLRSVSTREAPGLLDLELHVERQRRGERVEARPEVRRARRGRGRAGGAARSVRAPRARRAVERRLARDDRAGLLERGLRVLEPVAGQHAHDPLARRGRRGEQPGDRRGARRLAEDALARGEQPVRVEDLLVADRARPRRASRASPSSPPPSAPGCRSGSRSRRSRASRRARRARAARRPRPGSRTSAARLPISRKPFQ